MRMGVIIVAMLWAATGVLAQGPTQPPASAPPLDVPTVHDYGAIEKTCLRWTDGCRTCIRAPDGSWTCSNIGIACQPVAVSCTTRQEPAATPPN